MKNAAGVSKMNNCTQIMASLLVALMFAGCGKPNEYVEPPPPKVTVAKPLQQEVTDYLEFTGTTRGYEEVDVRARVSGFLQSMHFTPGTRVEKGDLLFLIDPRQYEAELNAAKAELSSAEAQLKRAEIEYERASRLFKQKAGAEKDVVKWRGQRDVAKADVLRAKAKVEDANLDLSYTKVTSPISGRVSRNFIDIGNLVGESEPTLLTNVTVFDPMYVYFYLNENDLLRVMSMYRQRIKEKGLDPEKDSDIEADVKIYLGLANEDGYPHEGTVDFAESGLDPGTGTLQLRGHFDNPGPANVLVPGLFTRLRMPIENRKNALLVTERAIGADQGGRYLLTVNSENVVEKRPIQMGQLTDGLRVIDEGLRPDEWVVVIGLQRSRPGGKVDPQQIDMATLTASAIKTAAQKNQGKASSAGSAPKKTEATQAAGVKPDKE